MEDVNLNLQESGMKSPESNALKSLLEQNDEKAIDRNDTNEISLGAALSLKDSCLECSTIRHIIFFFKKVP